MSSPKVLIQIKADRTGKGGSEMRVRMKPEAELKKLMTAWCTQHEMAADSAHFLWQGRKLRPDETVASVGWTSFNEPIIVNVERASKEVGPLQALAVEVHAEDGEGPNVLPFKMRLTTPVQNMTEAWYSHHRLAVGSAIFMLNNQELVGNGQDLGTVLSATGLDPQMPPNPIHIKAYPRSEENLACLHLQIQSTPARKLGSPSPSDHLPSPNPKFRLMGKQAPAKRKTTALPAEWKGLSSEALDVPSEVPITPKKVLKEVGKEEKKTPEKKRPRQDSERESARVSEPSKSLLKRRKKKHFASSETEACKCPSQAPLEPPDANKSQAAAAVTPDATFWMTVEAEGEDGPNRIRFKMEAGTVFQKMMTAWCLHHHIPVSDAAFILHGKELKPTDTFANLHLATDVVVRAVPRLPDGSVPESALNASLSRSDCCSNLVAPKKGTDYYPGEKMSPPPKRTLTSFQCYSRKRRVTLLEDRPEVKGSMAEQCRALAAEWKELGEQERKQYKEESIKDRERCKDEMLAYQERHPEYQPQKRKWKAKAGPQKRQKRREDEKQDSRGARPLARQEVPNDNRTVRDDRDGNQPVSSKTKSSPVTGGRASTACAPIEPAPAPLWQSKAEYEGSHAGGWPDWLPVNWSIGRSTTHKPDRLGRLRRAYKHPGTGTKKQHCEEREMQAKRVIQEAEQKKRAIQEAEEQAKRAIQQAEERDKQAKSAIEEAEQAKRAIEKQNPSSKKPPDAKVSGQSDAQASSPFHEELHLGPFIVKLERRLGQGSFGTVFLATYKPSGRQVAVKVCLGQDRTEELKNEAQIYSRLSSRGGGHDNVLTCLDNSFREQPQKNFHDISWLALPLVTSGSLYKFLKKQGPLKSPASAAATYQCASALLHLHQCEVVHLDVKPLNILWDDSSQHLWLMDFGSSDVCVPKSGALGMAKDWYTTPAYRPPELWKRRPDRRCLCPLADVFSFGCTVFELHVGSRLSTQVFRGSNVAADHADGFAWITRWSGLRRGAAANDLRQRFGVSSLSARACQCVWECCSTQPFERADGLKNALNYFSA